MSFKRFGTVEGVFIPTFLSILGVIMFLRLGWVVGQVGLKGALFIVVISNVITLFTGLSAASITTNIRIGTGGAYSIISKSLGYEIGGAIGIPLYISQAISVAFYIAGFSECWISVFPAHDLLFVSVITWIVLLFISYISARLAMRIQYGIMAVIALSLLSVFLAKGRTGQVDMFSAGVNSVSFWGVFTIFFPAVTGILTGISMSGELKNPRRSIPRGTIAAILASFIIYIALTFWFAGIATSEELVRNTSIVIDASRWRIFVIAGIMGATISSALSMFVASPRTLLALAKHKITPLSSSFSRINAKGEPATAILFTALISLGTIVAGTLNNIASILTMFFLITYGMLNIAVFIEKSIGIVSYRPAFKVPLFISFFGGAGCIYTMFLINPLMSVIALLVVIVITVLLLRKQAPSNWPDVRRGLFIFIAERAVKIAGNLPYHPKIWKPNLLIPVEKPRSWLGITDLIKAITFPGGRVELFSVLESHGGVAAVDDEEEKGLSGSSGKRADDLNRLEKSLSNEGVFVSSLVVSADNFLEAADIVVQTKKNSYLPPNVLFIKLGLRPDKDPAISELVKKIRPNDFGIMIFSLHPKIGLGKKRVINLWVRRGSPNVDLAVLVAIQLEKNWEANFRILQIVCSETEKTEAYEYLMKLKKIMRLSKETELQVLVGDFSQIISEAPAADVNIFGMPEECDLAWLRKVSDRVESSILYLRDSKRESAIV